MLALRTLEEIGDVGDELGDDVHVAVEYLAESLGREFERPAVGLAHALPASGGFNNGVEDEAHKFDWDRDAVAFALCRLARPLEGLSQLNQTLDRIRSAVFPDLQIRGVLLTMYDGRTNLSNDVVDEVRRHFKELVFTTVIPRTVRLAEAPSYGQPISIYAPSSNGAESYTSLAREILSGDGIEIPIMEN